MNVRFGAFEVDLEGHRLLKRGVPISLREQSFQVPATLMERPGEIVTREELRQYRKGFLAKDFYEDATLIVSMLPAEPVGNVVPCYARTNRTCLNRTGQKTQKRQSTCELVNSLRQHDISRGGGHHEHRDRDHDNRRR
jgi:hypothetical protein